MSSTEMESLCERIDSCLLEHLELVQAYLNQRGRTDTLLNAGFLELAQAKFVLGPNSVTRSQYDGRMQAATRVGWTPKETPANSNSSEVVHGAVLDWLAITLVTLTPATSRKANIGGETSPDLSPLPAPKSRRQRLNVLSSDIDNAGEGEVPLGTAVESSGANDPVLWFGGFLAPSSLRTAQTKFKQAVSELVELIRLQQQISSMERNLQEMLTKKRTLMAKQQPPDLITI